MSSPQNQLAKYRSYSYYHVLAICDSSATAVALASSPDAKSWSHPTGPDITESGITLPRMFTPKSVDGAGKYCILINGSTDAALSITRASWTSFTAASATKDDRNTSIATEGKLSISEPRGITCLDTIVRCCLTLGVDSANAFWVLKTFFVGYTYDTQNDSDGVEHITDIPPVIFIAYDVTGSFSAAGGEYEVSFVAAANGAARLPQYSKAASSINLKAKGTLAETVVEFGKAINNNYKTYYACVYEQVKSIDPETAESLRKVKYDISVGEDYQNSVYTVTDQIPNIKDTIHCESPANISHPVSVSIEDGLHQIVAKCKKIKEEADVGVDGKKYIHKISNWLTSYPDPDDKNKLAFEVGYRIDRQIQPRSMVFEDFAKGNVDENNPNLITFDYTYTGKNIDILEMDLKMNMGMVYLQGMTIANPYKFPGGTTQNKSHHVDSQGLLRFDGRNIPVFLGTHIKTASIKDTNDMKTTSQQVYNMSKHASLEVLETTMTITGNTQLLGSTNIITNPHHVASGPRQTTVLNSPNSALQNWTLTPSFAKVNIKMPRNNDDIALFSGAQTASDSDNKSNDYAVDFWFTGYYYVYQIEHIFDNGEFSQVLNAVGIPPNNLFRTQKSNAQEQDKTLEKKIDSCYERHTGCGSSGHEGIDSAMYIPEPVKGSDNIVPENTNDAKLINENNKDLSAIIGVDDPANAESVAAIKRAAAEQGVDEVTLAQMCAVESDFNPNATNPYGYKGLFQFGKAGWSDYGSGNIYDPYDNATAAAKMMKYNQGELKKVLGREPTKGEIYMAHQQGLGRAKKIVKTINSGEGGKQGLLSGKNASRNAISDNSAQGVYNYSETIMAKQLKKGMKVAKSVKPVTGNQNENDNGLISEKFKKRVSKPLKDVLSASYDCGEKEKQAAPDKNTTCPQLGDKSTATTETPSESFVTTGTVPGPRQPIVGSGDIPGGILDTLPKTS